MFDAIYMTGFKKFGGMKTNPTELIINEYMIKQSNRINLNVLDVSIKDVDRYIDEIKQKIFSNPALKILNLHLGVGNNTIYHLQKYSYNQNDFRIPDNNGVIQKKLPICQNIAYKSSLSCRIDLQVFADKLGSKSKISDDPGRFLCNYIYFCSMNKLCCISPNVASLFIHIPQEHITCHNDNMLFINQLLNLFLKEQK